MSLENFRAYQISLEFYFLCERHRCAKHLREQLQRASSSITLNLAEGAAKHTAKERARFYYIALGSLRECEAILDLSSAAKDSEIRNVMDKLGANVYQLCKSQKSPTPETPP